MTRDTKQLDATMRRSKSRDGTKPRDDTRRHRTTTTQNDAMQHETILHDTPQHTAKPKPAPQPPSHGSALQPPPSQGPAKQGQASPSPRNRESTISESGGIDFLSISQIMEELEGLGNNQNRGFTIWRFKFRVVPRFLWHPPGRLSQPRATKQPKTRHEAAHVKQNSKTEL